MRIIGMLGVAALCTLAVVAMADQRLCHTPACGPVEFNLTSSSAMSRYGVLVETPETAGCASVQFVVTDAQARVLGQTAALEPGRLQVVRIGHGFTAGQHVLQIIASGCAAQPSSLRRVTIGKASPDHGWRAAAAMAAAL